MKPLVVVRSLVAIVLGLFVITLVAESIEFLLVTAVNGGVESDPERYFAIRNRGWLLALKLLYNTLAAVVGGYVCARVAGRAPLFHGRLLALIQTAAFVWALSQPEMARTAPAWLWLALIAVSIAGILTGARMAGPRPPSRR